MPEGVQVDVYTGTLFRRHQAWQEASSTRSGATRVVLTGKTTFGDVTVRTRRLRERVAEGLSGLRRGRREDAR